LGVDVFFGLSGFLITVLLLAERQRTGSINLLAFYRRRAVRILPASLVFLATVGACGLFKTRWELAASLFFFRNYLPSKHATYATAHLWSLAVEEHFYLLWPGLLAVAGVAFWRSWIGHAALGIALWRLSALSGHWAELANINAMQRTDFRLDALLWGCAVAFLYIYQPDKLAIRPWLWISMAALVLFPYFTQDADGGFMLRLVASIAGPLLIPFLLAGTALQPTWALSRILEWPTLKWLGRISYSLYLWQELFLVAGLKSQFVLWNLAATLAVACASYYLIEQPMIRLGRKNLLKRSLFN